MPKATVTFSEFFKSRHFNFDRSVAQRFKKLIGNAGRSSLPTTRHTGTSQAQIPQRDTLCRKPVAQEGQSDSLLVFNSTEDFTARPWRYSHGTSFSAPSAVFEILVSGGWAVMPQRKSFSIPTPSAVLKNGPDIIKAADVVQDGREPESRVRSFRVSVWRANKFGMSSVFAWHAAF